MIIHARNIRVFKNEVTANCEVEGGSKIRMVFENPGLDIISCTPVVDKWYQLPVYFRLFALGVYSDTLPQEEDIEWGDLPC